MVADWSLRRSSRFEACDPPGAGGVEAIKGEIVANRGLTGIFR